MDLVQFINETEDLDKAINFSMKFGLLPDTTPKRCPKCEEKNSLMIAKYSSRNAFIPYNFICSKKSCNWTVPLCRNTVFDRINFPLSLGLRLIYFWLLKLSTKDSSDQLKLPESIVTEYYNHFRHVCAFIIINYTQPIGGPKHTVELSEFQLLSEEESRDVWMISGIDRGNGENFVTNVSVLDADTLWPIIKNYILPGSVIVTDRHKEFTRKEKEADNPSLKFVHTSKKPRTEDDYHLDAMWNAMVEYFEKEIPPDSIDSRELFAYQFLYFNRDEYCDKPASELLLPFLKDVKQVYPGFEKDMYR